MSFVSPVFPLFLAAVLLLTPRIPARRRWLLLLPASLLFYAWGNAWLLVLLGAVILVSYGCARGMEGALPARRRGLLGLGCAGCLALLFVFKYLDLAAGGVCAALRLSGCEVSFDGFGLLLPMGISFYTFQAMAYMMDVYRGTVRPERHLGRYALFVSFFPQLVAGPIERSGDLLPQLNAMPEPDTAMKADGVRLLVRGFAKKIMVADCISCFVDAAYRDPMAAGGTAMVLATALFAVQIYCDFSGYTDIARGCALLLGIRLQENFLRPYAAVTVRDFWRRWHISLTRWFTDYIYIPLGGSRRGKARHCVNILLVFLISGLWHGADLTFVLWGGLHGLFLVGETLLDRGRAPKHPHLRRCLTLLLVGFAWIFFRADSVHAAGEILRTIVLSPQPGQWLSGLGMTWTQALMVLGLLAALPLLERLPVLGQDERAPGVLLAYFLVIVGIVCCRLMMLHQGGAAAFIYFRF